MYIFLYVECIDELLIASLLIANNKISMDSRKYLQDLQGGAGDEIQHCLGVYLG